MVTSGPHQWRAGTRRRLIAHRGVATRRAICVWIVLGACGGVTPACRTKDSAQRAPMPVASVITARPDRRVFFQEFVAKRVGHDRESRQVFELPPRARPPFALLLDYAVDHHGAVIVEINGTHVARAPSFPASGHYDDSRRLEFPLALSRFETNDISTTIATVGWGFAKIQVVGYWADD